MLNLRCYIKYLLINRCYLSTSKSDLIKSSLNIQEILKSHDENFSSSLFDSINKIHLEYPSSKVATSTKLVYETNASSLNSTFVKLENDRKNEFGEFKLNNLIILLRYIRYLEIAFIYRLITFDINIPLKQTSNLILNLTKTETNFNSTSSISLISELTFFVNYLNSKYSLSDVKSLLSSTLIIHYLSNYLLNQLNNNPSILLINQLCLTLYSLFQISSSHLLSHNLLKYLGNQRSSSLSILKYLILIQHSSIQQTSTETISLLNKYLNQIAIHQENFYVISQLLILISAFNYSHQLFQREINNKILNKIKQKELFDVKLYSRLIYYLCLNDPTNRFQSRPIIVELSRKLNENLDKETKYPQWIVQAQHGMMLCNIYNYQLLSSTLQPTLLPLLFRDMGIYTLSIQRQLFDIHHVLSIDRPSRVTPLLNHQMLSFAAKISDEYRLTVRSNQKSYNTFLIQLKESFNEIYGPETSEIINTDEKYPYLLFDFLEVNLPECEELRAIGINPSKRIGVLPILNSMLIRQQRADGSLVRVLSAHTTMRYRIVEKQNYQVLTIFHGQYLRALRDNTIKTLFQTNLALKSKPD